MSCPYDNCFKKFHVRSSFSSHLSRKHKTSPCTSSTATVGTADVSLNGEMTQTSHTCLDGENGNVNYRLNDGNDNASNEVDDNDFMNSLALFYLKMQAKMLLPASVIQKLMEKFQEVHSSSTAHLLSKLHEDLTKLNVPENDIKDLIDRLIKNELLKMCNEGVLRSDQTRKTLFKSKFNYIEPTPMYLGVDANGKERFCQYVSIKDTVKALLSQTAFQEQYLQTKSDAPPTPDVLEDLKDGKNIKNNKLLQESPSSISILLYQDSFEVANPLGSGKKKHKILAVYTV